MSKREGRNSRIYKIQELFGKYRATSVSELYDRCSDGEWEQILYMPAYQELIQAARSLYIKKQLTQQRDNRWKYALDHAHRYYKPDLQQITEIQRLLQRNRIKENKLANAVMNLLTCVHEKKNAIKLWGVPDSGKSLLANAIVKPFITCYMNNHGSENEFFSSNMLNKSVILCEELYITIATAEDFKSILGGQPIDVSRKYDEKQLLGRTPVVVTSNYDKFGRGHLSTTDENALNLRCELFYFCSAYKPGRHIDWWNVYFFLEKCIF